MHVLRPTSIWRSLPTLVGPDGDVPVIGLIKSAKLLRNAEDAHDNQKLPDCMACRVCAAAGSLLIRSKARNDERVSDHWQS